MRVGRCVLAAFIMLLSGCRRTEMKKPLIAIIVPSQDNPFFKVEADAAAAKAIALGYRVRVDAHDDDAYRQDMLIDGAIASHAAAIILDNAGADSSVSAVRRATRAGIPCFLIDREIDARGIAKAQIVADNRQGAEMVAKAFADALPTSGAAYAELLGRESDTNAQVRTAGFHAVLDKLPGLHRVAAQSANWSQAEAFQKTETILQSHPGIKGIIAGNDTMVIGASAAVKTAGLKNIVLVGFDGSPDAVSAIQAGTITATALQPAVVISRMAVEEADSFLKSGNTGRPEVQVIACDLVTQSNATHFRNFERIE